MPFVQAHIVDSLGDLLPVGFEGELCLSGPCLTVGYLNRADLNRELFVPNPFGKVPGYERLYRTGDRARYRSDGSIEFLGRIDAQVKVRGFRIELGEIESVAAEHPEVRDAVVVVKQTPQGTSALIGYLIASVDSLDKVSVQTHLKTQLPAHMVPASLQVIESFPLTPNGKIDRKNLESREPERVPTRVIPPRTATETELAALWCQVLKSDHDISVHDDFFALGGSSLLVLRLVSQIQRGLGKTVTLGALAKAPTIAQQAALLDGDSDLSALSPVTQLAEGHAGEVPVVLVHGGDGGAVFYRDLIARLHGLRHPVYIRRGSAAFGSSVPTTLA